MHSLYHASPALGQRVSNKQFTIGHCILPPFFKMWMNIWRVIFFFLGSYKDWVLKSRVKKRIMSWVWPSYYLVTSRWKKGKLHLKILFSVPLVEGINWQPSIIYRLNTTMLVVLRIFCSLVFLVIWHVSNDLDHTSYLSQTPQTCLCKNFLSGVNFSRLSEKNAYIWLFQRHF